jgi:hypothetical protein
MFIANWIGDGEWGGAVQAGIRAGQPKILFKIAPTS